MKKLLCIILCIMFCFQGISVFAKDYPDTLNEDCERAADVLLALEIMYPTEDGLFEKEAFITRSEAVVTIMRLLNRDDFTRPTEEISESYFVDVEPYYWALEDIDFAYECGIISMNSEKTFRPDDYVTFNEFTKMMVIALGYDMEAGTLGDYPLGYMLQAEKLDLFKNVKYTGNQPVTRGSAAIFLYNALHTNIRRFINNSGYIKYYLGKTVLEEYFGLQRGTGIVTANDVTGLSGTGAVRENYISIDYSAYLSKDENAGRLLGKKVEYYVDIDEENPTIFYCTEVGMKNSYLELSNVDTDYGYDKSAEKYYSLNEKGNKVYYPVYKKADIIYNGKLYVPTDGSAVNMVPEIGNVTLIDNNDDGEYDVICVKEYKNYVYKGYNSYDEKLISEGYSKDYKEIILNLDISEDSKYEVRFADNKAVPLNSLKKNSVLSVAMSADNSYYEVIISTQYYSGKVDSIEDNGEYKFVVIDGTERKMYKDTAAYGSVDTQSIGVFYLDFLGNIVLYESDESIVKYGFIQTVKIDSDSLSKNVRVRIFTQNGEFETYETAKNINIDSVTCKSVAEIDAALENGKSQLVRYKLTNDNKINFIDTVNNYVDGDGTLHYAKDINETEIKDSSLYYYEDPNTIGTTEGANTYMGGATIFVIPDDDDLDNEDQYNIITKASLVDADKYTMSAFCAESYMNTEALVLRYSDVGEPKAGYDMVIIEKVSNAYDAINDDTFIKIVGKANGQSCTFKVYSAAATAYTTAQGISEGDVCMFGIDTNGKTTSIEHIYKYKDDTFNGYTSNSSADATFAKSNYFTRYRVILGYIDERYENLIKFVSACEGPGTTSVYDLSKSKVYKYDPEKALGSRVQTITTDELLSDDFIGKQMNIIIKTYFGRPSDIYIPYK